MTPDEKIAALEAENTALRKHRVKLRKGLRRLLGYISNEDAREYAERLLNETDIYELHSK